VFLLDTNVVSLASPLTGVESSEARAWLGRVADRSFISVITIAELQYGASRLLATGSSRKGTALAAWVAGILNDFSDRVLAVEIATARRAGELYARAMAGGDDPEFQDSCIAATADLHGFAVVTYNARHFAAFGVPFIAPGDDE
jgi:toxin FitB